MLPWAPEALMLAALLVPIAAATFIPVFSNWANAREAVTLLAAFALAVIVWLLLPTVLAGGRPELAGFEIVAGLKVAFKLEPLGMLFALVAGTLWLVNSIYSIGYMRANNEPRQTQFYVCFAVAIAATIAVAFAANLFTLFLFYEVLTLTTYPLVTHKGSADAKKAGRTYLLILMGTSMLLFLPAMIITSGVAGTLDFTPGGVLDGKLNGPLLGGLLALFIYGIGKAAVMPVHYWLPAAMAAPTPVSALLHAVAVVKAGVFSVVKIVVYIFGIETLTRTSDTTWFVVIASFTIIAASLVALRQDNLKKRLAYSTISQLSYVVLATAILTPLSVMGAIIHIAGHAVAKITLFFAAGSIYTAARKTEVSQLDGIGWKMPWTMTAFTIGALAMIGLPPTSGFLGKWFVLSGAMTTEQWLPVVVIIVSTVLNAAYFLPVVIRAFFCEPARSLSAAGPTEDHRSAAGPTEDHGEAPWPMVLALTFTAAATIGLFLFPEVPWTLAELTVGAAKQ